AVIFPQITHLTADEEARAHLEHRAERRANSGFLPHPSTKKMGPFRLIDEVESHDRKIWNKFPINRERELRAKVPDARSGRIIDPVEVTLRGDRQAERGNIPFQKPVSQIDGNPLPAQLVAIF